ncbi:MAG: NUDIX hydrolase [Methylocystis sp.]|jgi:8-oxo-dGTP pyrophosphatase MutT (NUDIX family)
MTASCQIFEADRLDCRLVEHRLDLSEGDERRVEEFWRDQTSRNPSLYDGRILLARRAEPLVDASGQRTLEVEFFEAPFSRFYAWKQFGQPDWGVLNCFSAPALRSSDGAFLAGEMGRDHSQPGLIYFPCGTPDHDDVVGSRVDLTGCLIRELAEETGVQIDERDLAPVWRIISVKKQRACLRIVTLGSDAQSEVEKVERHIRSQQKPELAGMRVFRRRADLAEPRLTVFMKAFLESVLED